MNPNNPPKQEFNLTLPEDRALLIGNIITHIQRSVSNVIFYVNNTSEEFHAVEIAHAIAKLREAQHWLVDYHSVLQQHVPQADEAPTETVAVEEAKPKTPFNPVIIPTPNS